MGAIQVLYDADVMIAGDIMPVLQCAAQNYFISTSGPNSPLNLGFLAFRPDQRLLLAALYFAQTVEYDKPPRGSTSRRRSRGGWDDVGSVQTEIASHRALLLVSAIVHRTTTQRILRGAMWSHATLCRTLGQVRA